MGLDALLDAPRFANNAARLENKDALNEILQAWLGSRPTDDIMDELIPAGGVVGRSITAPTSWPTPTISSATTSLTLTTRNWAATKMLGLVPKFSATPGQLRHMGPTVGQHNASVYGNWLGLTENDLVTLSADGIV